MAIKLAPEERIVYAGRPSWRSIPGFYLRGLALTTAAALVVAVVTLAAGGRSDPSLVLLVAMAGVAATVLAGFLRRAASGYTVTDRRVHIRRGLLARTVEEIGLDRVRAVSCRQAPFERLLGIGNVELDVAGAEAPGLRLSGVGSPARIARAVSEAQRAGGAGGA